MDWSTDPEPVNAKDNITAIDAADTLKGAGQPAVQDPDRSTTNTEITEILACHGAKCTCDQASDPSYKPLKVLSHNKYVINDNGETKLIATTLENKLLNLNFGQCKVPDPGKPVPCTAKLQWKDYYEKVELPNGAYVLTDKSTAICTAKGGNIKIVQHGQQLDITPRELENTSAGSWVADGPLLTEEFMYTSAVAKNNDEDGAAVKSIAPLTYGKLQPLNSPVTFRAEFYGQPGDAEKQGVNWVIYDTNGEPMQLRSDAGETITITFKKAGIYLIEAYGKANGDKKVTRAYTIKENTIETVTTVDGKTKVRVQVPVTFRLKSLFPGLAVPGDISTISWEVTKTSGTGVPALLTPTGNITQVICNDECTYVVSACFNGVPKQSEQIHALRNGITSVIASVESTRIKEQIIFSVKDHFKVLPALPEESAAVKWICKNDEGKPVEAFETKTGETVSHQFEEPGEYTVQAYLVQPGAKVAVKITVAQPALILAQWEYPEGGRKTKTGWGEKNHAYLKFKAAEGITVNLEYGYIDGDGNARAMHVINGFKVPKNQVPDTEKYPFIAHAAQYSKLLKAGTEFYFKVHAADKKYEILNGDIPQPLQKLKLVTGEEIVSIEFLTDGKAVIQALYGSKMQCRIRTRNLSAKNISVKIYRKESRLGLDNLRNDTLVHHKEYPLNPDGTVEFDFTLDKSWEKSYSEKLHRFYAVIGEMEFFGISNTLMAFKNDVPANGGKALVGIGRQEGGNSKCYCKENSFHWSNRLTCEQRKKVLQVCAELWGEDKKKEKASELMSVMHLETNNTFSPSSDNGVGFSGLIQFSDAAAKSVGTTRAELKQMTFIKQMDYVKKYLEKKKEKLNAISDLYLMVLKPNAVGQGSNPNYVLFDESIEVPNVPFDKDNIDKEPWVTKYGYSSNSSFMQEKGEWDNKRMFKTYSKGMKQRRGFTNGKTFVWEVTNVLIDHHYNPGKSEIFIGKCANIEEEDLKKVTNKRTPWMKTVINEAQLYGGKSQSKIQSRVTAYHKVGANYSGIEDAWCSSFACWCLENSDPRFETPHSPGSASFINHKTVEKCEAFYGAIATFSDCDPQGNITTGKGHVTFIYGKLSGDKIYAVLGGNQNNMIKVSKYDCSGNVFFSYQKKNGTKIYKKFRGFFKPKGYIIKEIDKLVDSDNYNNIDDANKKIGLSSIKTIAGERDN
ncbi:PAAR-like protein [Pedobacter sp. 22226]|uniref:PAAR-like protein n=1 Tax=Pedobacter sp. 22226 TaxID=3453894 RepID=UPI003F8624E5